MDFESAMLSFIRSNNADLLDKINESGDFNDEIAGEMKAAIEKFKASGTY